MLQRVVIFHHPQSEGAAMLGEQILREFHRHNVEVTLAHAWDESARPAIRDAGLIVCIGGDGTVLRAARVAVPYSVPILGINMGRLGFLTDMSPRDFFNHFERVIDRDWRIEERMMVRAEIRNGPDVPPNRFHALNDVVVSRRLPGRPVYVDLRIDDAEVAEYRCDGMIVCTPTGSTGYSLSAGGPILAPTEHHLVITPVSPHLALARSLVLQPDSEVELAVTADEGAILSVDGQEEVPLVVGARVLAGVSDHVTRFVRFTPPSSFYAFLAERLEGQLSSTRRRHRD